MTSLSSGASFQVVNGKTYQKMYFSINILNKHLLLAKCEVCMASYGPSFFLSFMAQVRSARAMKTRKEKTRIHNLLYGPSKQG